MGSFSQVDVPSPTLHDRHLMSLNKFNQGLIGIFNVGEATGRFSHVEGRGAIYCEGETNFFESSLKLVHINDIEADMNKPRVSPVAPFINVIRLAVFTLNQFNIDITEKAAEGSGNVFLFSQEYPSVFVQRVQIVESSILIVYGFTETQGITVDWESPVNV